MKWVSVKDKLPENTDIVLVFCHYHIDGDAWEDYKVMRYDLQEKIWWLQGAGVVIPIVNGKDYGVTHWAKLEPPKDIE